MNDANGMNGVPAVMNGGAMVETTYLDKKQVAQRLKVSPRTVDNLMRNGVLPYHKLGRLVRFRPDDVDAHLQRHCRFCANRTGEQQGNAAIVKAESEN